MSGAAGKPDQGGAGQETNDVAAYFAQTVSQGQELRAHGTKATLIAGHVPGADESVRS
jgi:hypothetical protein